MTLVFASYSRWDRRSNPMVNRVLNGLRLGGVPLWFAPDSIPAGVDWHSAIEDTLDQASAHLVFVSKRYPKARGMQREIERSREAGVPLIVILLDPAAADMLPASVREGAVNAISLYAATDPDDFSAVLSEIMLALPAAVRGPAQSSTAVNARALETMAQEAAAAAREIADDSPVQMPRSVGYVFISYAEPDTPFVSRLRDFLRTRGYGYWDYQETDRSFDLLLSEELELALQNASAVISVVSPAWRTSRWTRREYLYAEEIGQRIFVVRIQETEPSIILAGVTYIDFMRDETAGFARLDRELHRRGLLAAAPTS
jgi:hypothetical protein